MQKLKLTKLLTAGMLVAAFLVFPLIPVRGQEEKTGWETDNLNVLFIGFEEESLEMVAVYSINYRDRMQSGAVFFPVQALVPGEELSFRDFYREEGLRALRSAVEEALGIEIAYHVAINNAIMAEVEGIIGPITIEGKKLDLNKIFTMAPSPQDEEMLGELVRRLTRPEVYFWQLPKLCLAAHRHVITDFPLTLENLWLHYRIASKIPTDRLRKVILSVQVAPTERGLAWQLVEAQLARIIYDVTR